jgi:tetratricopeptide (TPR) repeat protein
MVTEGVGEARPEAEGELALARLALDSGEVAHAAAHAGNAIAADPALRAAYELLDELAAIAPDAAALFPLEERTHIGAGAARSYLAARAGELDEAFGLLCSIAQAAPDKPWAAGWLAAPGTTVRDLAGRMNPTTAVPSLSRLALSLPSPVDAEAAAALRPFLEVARVLVTAHPEPAKALPRLSGLARRLGEHKEAIAWCRRAEEIVPSSYAAIMLGFALRSAGRPDEAHEAWLRALQRDPGNVELRVDIAEHLAARGQLDEGIRWLDEALALSSEHPKAFPSACQMRHAKDGAVAHLLRLADWWREHPEHGYANAMLTKACKGEYWLSLVPFPSEAVCNMLADMAKKHPEPESWRSVNANSVLSALEVPSAMAAVKAALPGLTIAPAPTPAPDIRVPLAEGRYRLWTYRGTEAVPAVAAPSPEAVAALQAVADVGFWPHPLAAYDLTVPLSALSLDDLLGLIAHGVPVPEGNTLWQRMRAEIPAYWPRYTQAWACLGVLHHKADEPWPDSTRRHVLLDLVRGVEDWATDAALNAMVTAAWVDPSVRSDVVEIAVIRFADALRAQRRRVVTIADSLARLILITPGMPAEAMRTASMVIEHESATQTRAAAGAKPRKGRFRRGS